MRLKGTLIYFLSLFLFSGFCFGNEWAKVETPTSGPAKVIGSVSRGCISGALTLPSEGSGYQTMHLERRRYFGHPELVKTILAIGRTVEEEDLGILFVGDLAQARGGPTPTSHLSHQNGLDVDVWFTLERDLLKQLDAFRANVSAPSLLNGPGTELKRFLWKAGNARVLEFAAKRPSVDRIFVNPHIKNELCRTAPKNDRSWLRKIRPWWGHHDHFHMRLACPPGNPQCVSQKPLPEGDGCGQALDWWLHLQNTMRSPGSKVPRNIGIGRMPGSCSKVLSE